MKKILVEDWREAWTWLSAHVAVLAIAWGAMPQDVQASVLAAIGVPPSRVAAVLGLLFLAARLVRQRGIKPPTVTDAIDR